MACLNEQSLSTFLDGELPPAEQAAAEQHVAVCEACQETLRQYQLLGDVIRSSPMAEPSIAAQAAWLNSFRKTDRAVRTLASILTAAAAIVIAVTVAIPSRAQATSAAPTDWEQVAVAGSSDVNQTPQGTAQWIVADLSVGSGGGK